jgi:hypothetical protein
MPPHATYTFCRRHCSGISNLGTQNASYSCFQDPKQRPWYYDKFSNTEKPTPSVPKNSHRFKRPQQSLKIQTLRRRIQNSTLKDHHHVDPESSCISFKQNCVNTLLRKHAIMHNSWRSAKNTCFLTGDRGCKTRLVKNLQGAGMCLL